PAGATDLQIDRQRDALQHDGALGAAATEVLDGRPQRHGPAVRDGETAAGEVDDDPRAAVLRERVAVDGDLLAHRHLAPDAVVEGRGVVPGFGPLVVETPCVAE